MVATHYFNPIVVFRLELRRDELRLFQPFFIQINLNGSDPNHGLFTYFIKE